jgi:aryl-alcohol dehydrogenase-like predicted oxidoreductase
LVADAHRLVLGTAQWGQDYGIANTGGRPDRDELRAMLSLAAAEGIDTVDTARAYGESESLLGELAAKTRWRVVTKHAPDLLAHASTPAAVETAAAESLARSLAALRRDRLDALLLHRPDHRTAFDGAAWRYLQGQRASGVVASLGISLASARDAADALDDAAVELIEVPASLLDQRLARDGFFAAAAASGVEVLVRSIFLQGAAHLAVERLPAHLRALAPTLERLDDEAQRLGLRRLDLFTGYARGLPGARVIVGCETKAQLREVLDSWASTAGLDEELLPIAESVTELPAAVLDPARWPATRTPLPPSPS